MDFAKCRPVFFCIVGVLLSTYVVRINGEDASETPKSNATAIAEKKPVYTVPFISNELTSSWKNDIWDVLVVGGLVTGSLMLIGVFAWLLSPLFGYKICTLLGNCEVEAIPFSQGGNLQPYVQQNAFPGTFTTYDSPYTGNYYQKRSLNYVGPILKTLASAYEKYEQASTPSPKKE